MTKSIIEKIFLGGVGFCDSVKLSEKYEKISKKAYEVYFKLKEDLNERQKEIFNIYSDLRTEECAESDMTYFKEGVKLGILLCMDSMS